MKKQIIAFFVLTLIVGGNVLAQQEEATNNSRSPYAHHVFGGSMHLGRTSLNYKGDGITFGKAGAGFGLDFEYTYFMSRILGIKTGISYTHGKSFFYAGDGYTYTNKENTSNTVPIYTVDYRYVTTGQVETYKFSNVSIPLMLHLQGGIIYADAGLRITLPLGSTEASYESGSTKVTIDNISPTGNAGIYNALGANTYPTTSGKYAFDQPMWYDVAAEVGFRVRMSSSTSLRVGLYGEIALNNGKSESGVDMRVIDIDNIYGETNMRYIDCNSNNLADKMRYFNVGIRLGVDFGKITRSRGRSNSLFAEDNAPEPSDLMVFIRSNNGEEEYFGSYNNNEGEWSEAVSMMQMGNPKDRGASYSVSPKGDMVILSLTREGGMGGKDLYYTVKTGNDWSEPVSLGTNVNSSGEDFQPTLLPDGRTLYFVSNRVGGLGGNDLWLTTLQPDGTWSKAVNMGNAINTEGNDQTPVYYDGQLYFATNGREGEGGYDIYYMAVTPQYDLSGSAVNMGNKVNTPADESGVVMVTNTADKPQENPFAVSPQLSSYIQGDALLRGTVIDAVTQRPIGAHVYLTDEGGSTILTATDNDVRSGEFYISVKPGAHYTMNVSSDGYVLYSENISIENSSSMSMRILMQGYNSKHNVEPPVNSGTIVKNTVVSSERTAPAMHGEMMAGETLHTVQFQLGSNTLTADSRNSLLELANYLKEHPNVKVELGGHADITGSEERNILISWYRARSVYNVLLDMGVPASQMIRQGYGASMPIDSNETEEGRARNRRVDVRVLQ